MSGGVLLVVDGDDSKEVEKIARATLLTRTCVGFLSRGSLSANSKSGKSGQLARSARSASTRPRSMPRDELAATISAPTPAAVAIIIRKAQAFIATDQTVGIVIPKGQPFAQPGLKVSPNPDHASQARAANDRRLALAVHERLGTLLPGQRAVTRIDDLPQAGAWVAKAPWTAAGRDRIHGNGPPTGEQRVYAGRLLQRCGALLVEPWLERTLDLGVTARLDAGRVTASPPHTLLCDARGAFLGIDLAEPPLAREHRAQLDAFVAAAGDALATTGYAGPFTVDAFVHPGGLHACEINARHTFGHVARALGARVLGFGPPPPGAHVLVAPTADDPTTAWTS